tara:strand:- start:302856 stop:302972 length:117 start_codon:yes stop_codon:yes gene_type:complete
VNKNKEIFKELLKKRRFSLWNLSIALASVGGREYGNKL